MISQPVKALFIILVTLIVYPVRAQLNFSENTPVRLEIFGGKPTRVLEFGVDFNSLRSIFAEKTKKGYLDTINGEKILLEKSFYLNKRASVAEIDTILKYYNYLKSDTNCIESRTGSFRGSVRFVLYSESKRITIDIADVWAQRILLDGNMHYTCLGLWEYLVKQVPKRYRRGMNGDIRYIKKQEKENYGKNHCCKM